MNWSKFIVRDRSSLSTDGSALRWEVYDELGPNQACPFTPKTMVAIRELMSFLDTQKRLWTSQHLKNHEKLIANHDGSFSITEPPQ